MFQQSRIALGIAFAKALLALGACTTSTATASSFSTYCYEVDGRLEELRCDIALAQRAEDQQMVQELSEEMIQLLGTQAGIPQRTEEFRAMESSIEPIDLEISTAFSAYIDKIESLAWWTDSTAYPAPTAIGQPLRFPASVITGALAARRAGASEPEKLLDIAEDAAAYLLWAQAQGKAGLFPFPNWSSREGQLANIASGLVRIVEENPDLPPILINNWFVDDLGSGGLQYDNGLCGVAILELYEVTNNPEYLQSARLAADWTMQQPSVPNWNYNSFSVFLLANMYRVTGEDKYLDSAVEKANLGLYPGQLPTGRHQGRWADPHNARSVYHYIIIRGLVSLVSVMPDDHPGLEKATEVLSIALRTRNSDMMRNGVVSPGVAVEALVRLDLLVPPERLENDYSEDALSLLSQYAVEKFQAEQFPMEPRAWGLLLEHLSNQRSNVISHSNKEGLMRKPSEP